MRPIEVGAVLNGMREDDMPKAADVLDIYMDRLEEVVAAAREWRDAAAVPWRGYRTETAREVYRRIEDSEYALRTAMDALDGKDTLDSALERLGRGQFQHKAVQE